MYRRTGGRTAALRSPTESPPDWDLLNLIDLDFTSSFNTPCLNERSAPVKMKPHRIAPTISAIGSPWMEEEIKPVKSALESLQGLNLPEGVSLESLLSDRGSGLNTPPPLPILSDLSDYITAVDQAAGDPVLVGTIKGEEQRVRFPTLSESSSESHLLDPSIEDTVNLTKLFTLQDFGSDSGLLEDLNPSPLYLGSDQKQLDYEQEQQYIFDRSPLTVSPERYNTESSLLYLPSVCLDGERIEDKLVDEGKVEQLEHNNNFGSQSPAEIITISVEEFNRLAGDLELLQEAGLVLNPDVNQVVAPTKPANQLKPCPPVVASGTQKQEGRQDFEKAMPSGRNERKHSSGNSHSGSSRKRRIASLDKESEEYRDKRARNNESVRKSRDKAKARQEETEDRLQVLSNENRRLQSKVDSLEKELSVLRGLFTSTSTVLP